MNVEKMVSVVIPTHNRGNLLSRAIKSVQAQTYHNIEILVISDGSEDETKQIVKRFSSSDSRVKFIEYFPAQGGCYARNTGIKNAKGDYIAFLDDDDEWQPWKIEKQLKVFGSDSSIGLVYTGSHIIYVNEKTEYDFIPICKGNLKEHILIDNIIGTTSTVILKKSLLTDNILFDEKLKALQDYELWIRLCQLCNVGVVQEAAINYYNYLGKKQISAITKNYEDAFSYINTKHGALFAKLSDIQKQRKIISENMLLANKAFRNGNASLARKYAIKAFKSKMSVKPLLYYVLSFTSYNLVLKIRSLLR